MSIDYSALAFAKPSKEDGLLARRKAKAEIKAHEANEKAQVVKRDGLHYCRLVPHCEERERHETAHLNDKGMGGDHSLRTTSSQMIRSCFFHHQGNWSLHSQDLRVTSLTSQGANGPIEVWGRAKTGEWYMVGRETAVGVWERD